MALDPSIIAIFGEVPAGVDLGEHKVIGYNASVCVVLGLAAISVALRFYVRSIKGAKIWHDDYVILISVFFCILTTFMTVLAGAYGAGEHVWATNMPRFLILLKIVFAEPFIYAAAVTSTKISILLLYRRLFDAKTALSRLYTALFWTATFLTMIYPIIQWVGTALSCSPVSYFWNRYLGARGSCINGGLFFFTSGIVNMLDDIVILLVPVPRIWELQMNKRTKFSIFGIMLLGGFVCIASIVRIYYLHGFFRSIDTTWWMGPVFAWSSLEPSIAVISACLPTFAPLFRMGRKGSSRRSTYPYVGDRSGGISEAGVRTIGVRGNRGGGFGGAHSNARKSRMDDDEVELTCTIKGGDASSSHATESKGSSDIERGIMVKTQVSVVSHKYGDD